MKLQNKVAVITGGSSGIGLATARRFGAEGAHVFITGRRQSELDQAKIKLGVNVTAVQGDVANLDDLDRLYRTVASRTGVVDIVFPNAGFVELLTIDAVTPEHFDKTININLRGLLFTVQKALPLMKNGGSIVLTSSVVGVMGLPGHGVYGALPRLACGRSRGPGGGTGEPRHSCERGEPRRHGHPDHRRRVHHHEGGRQRESHIRGEDPARSHRPLRRAGVGGPVPGVR
jgi:hypothetical protein